MKGRLVPFRDEIVQQHLGGANLAEIARRYGCSREAIPLIVAEKLGRTLTRERYKEAGEHPPAHDYSAYSRGCRCDICRAAKAAYMRSWRRARTS